MSQSAYQEALVKWAKGYLKRKKIAQPTDVRVSVYATYDEGCPTCGGNVEHRVNIYYKQGAKQKIISETWSLETLLEELLTNT